MWSSQLDESNSVKKSEFVDYRNDQVGFMAELAVIANEIRTNDELDGQTYIDNLLTLWDTRYQRLREEYDIGNYIESPEMHKYILDATLAEKHIWSLLEGLTKVELHFLESGGDKGGLNSMTSINDDCNNLLHPADFHSEQLRGHKGLLHSYAVLDWLEGLCEERVCSSEMKQSAVVSPLPLDASFRRAGVRDAFEENSRACFQRLTCGTLLDSELSDSWRTASISGGRELDVTEDGAAVLSQRELRTRWTKACAALSGNMQCSFYESRVYSILSGIAGSFLDADEKDTWETVLWAFLKPRYLAADNAISCAPIGHRSIDIMDKLMHNSADARSIVSQSGLQVMAVPESNSNSSSSSSVVSTSVNTLDVVTNLRKHFPLPYVQDKPSVANLTAQWTQNIAELQLLQEYNAVAVECSKQVVALTNLMKQDNQSFSTPGMLTLLRGYVAFVVHVVLFFLLLKPSTCSMSDSCAHLLVLAVQQLCAQPQLHQYIPNYAQYLPGQYVCSVYEHYLSGLSSYMEVQLALQTAKQNPYIAAHYNQISKCVAHIMAHDHVVEDNRQSLFLTPSKKSTGSVSSKRRGTFNANMNDDGDDKYDEGLISDSAAAPVFSIFAPTPVKHGSVFDYSSKTPLRTPAKTGSKFSTAHYEFQAWMAQWLDRSSPTVAAFFLPSDFNQHALLEKLPATTRQQIESTRLLYTDGVSSADCVQVTTDAARLAYAGLFVNGLFRAFLVTQQTVPFEVLHVECASLFTSFEMDFATNYTLLHDTTALQAYLTSTVDKDLQPEKISQIEQVGNVQRELHCHSLYYNLLVSWRAFLSVYFDRPVLSELHDAYDWDVRSSDSIQQQRENWNKQVQDKVLNVQESIKLLLSFPYGLFHDVSLPHSSHEAQAERAAELHSVAEVVTSQIAGFVGILVNALRECSDSMGAVNSVVKSFVSLLGTNEYLRGCMTKEATEYLLIPVLAALTTK